MIGKDYESYESFITSCKSQRISLDSRRILGKLYTIEQLRELAEYLQISSSDLNEVIEEGDSENKKGVTRRYDFAKAISRLVSAEQIGETISYLDHSFHFPILFYLRIPHKTSINSQVDLIKSLKQHHASINDDHFQMVFNGMINPAGGASVLESIRLHEEDSVSLLFSCSRVLLSPEGQIGNYNDYFLARVPVLVYFYFSRRLIEISMPTFSEVVSIHSISTRFPDRYQIIAQGMQPNLLEITLGQLNAINFKKLAMFLEIQLGGIDMGWKIEPEHEAAFDFTQNVIPLRKILDAFSQSLRSEFEKRERKFPLKTDLYNLFRALKEQSYTYSLVLQVPLGNRKGKVKAATLYGSPNRGYPPLLLLSKNDIDIRRNLIEAVDRSQTEKIENPYDLDRIFLGS
jgi:hypothetical protein